MNGQRLRERRQKKVEMELRRGYEHKIELALRMAPREVKIGISIETAPTCLAALHLVGASELLCTAYISCPKHSKLRLSQRCYQHECC